MQLSKFDSNAMASYIDLPQGWSREEVVRKTGLSAGKTDIYYHGPDGKKYRSKPQIARELGEGYDLSAFDFKTGRMIAQSGTGYASSGGNSSLLRKARGKKPVSAYDYTKAFKPNVELTLPVRQTASIFKQPVTVIRSHPESKVRTDLKHGPADAVQPRQLFWEKSLLGLKCCDLNEEVLQAIDLPSKIKGLEPSVTTETLLQSIAAALHANNQPVVGQSHSATKFLKNPTVHINTSQPVIQQIHITGEDVKNQEGQVELSRKRLEAFLAAIEKSEREAIEQETLIDPINGTQSDVSDDSEKPSSPGPLDTQQEIESHCKPAAQTVTLTAHTDVMSDKSDICSAERKRKLDGSDELNSFHQPAAKHLATSDDTGAAHSDVKLSSSEEVVGSDSTSTELAGTPIAAVSAETTPSDGLN